MPLLPATPSDLSAVADLVNGAYRGTGEVRGWTDEADFLGGQRTDAETLRADLAARPGARLLVWRDDPGAPLLGCMWLEPADPAQPAAWYLGMLTVRPDLQGRRLGRELLAAAEAEAAARGAHRVRMHVVNVRDALIAWYRRRGYERTGETRPFPYGDERAGDPRRDDLNFVVLEKEISHAAG